VIGGIAIEAQTNHAVEIASDLNLGSEIGIELNSIQEPK
jgi:hypothetical protein